MNTQRILFFCFLVSGQLLAMEEKSQALAVKKSDEVSALAGDHAHGDTSRQTFWGKVTSIVGAWFSDMDDGAVRFHKDMRAFLDRCENGNKIDELDLADLQKVIDELAALRRSPYFVKEQPELVKSINLLYEDLETLLCVKQIKQRRSSNSRL